MVVHEVPLLQATRLSRQDVPGWTSGAPQRRSLGSTPLADRESREFKQRAQGAVCHSFHYHLARLTEMLHVIERIQELCDDSALLGRHLRVQAGQNRDDGIGCCEAPRRTLFHHYHVDDRGLITKVNLLIATAQNNVAMNKALEQTARRFISGRSLQEGMLNRVEAAIRWAQQVAQPTLITSSMRHHRVKS